MNNRAEKVQEGRENAEFVNKITNLIRPIGVEKKTNTKKIKLKKGKGTKGGVIGGVSRTPTRKSQSKSTFWVE